MKNEVYNCVILSHFDFENDKKERVFGSKVAISNGVRVIEIITKDEEILKMPVLTSCKVYLKLNEFFKPEVSSIVINKL